MIAGISTGTFAAIIGGLISGAVVLLGVLLAENLRTRSWRRRRIMTLLLSGHTLMDRFISTLDPQSGMPTDKTLPAVNAVSEVVIELQALSRIGTRMKRQIRSQQRNAMHEFILKLSAVKLRLIRGGRFRPEEIHALMDAMSAYESLFEGTPSEYEQAVIIRYDEHGIDSEPLSESG